MLKLSPGEGDSKVNIFCVGRRDCRDAFRLSPGKANSEIDIFCPCISERREDVGAVIGEEMSVGFNSPESAM